MPNLRLIPIVVFAALCLLAIKTVGFMGEGKPPAGATWDQMAGASDAEPDPIVTGAMPEKKDSAPPMAALPRDKVAKGAPGGKELPAKNPMLAGAEGAERALIERLQERRQELEARARDLEMRESLLKAAEKQLDTRIGAMKEENAGAAEPTEQIKSLVVMYESMGPKEAARIFDRLDPRTLVDLVNHMNPRKVAEIMAKMQPEAAERMTLELARGRKPAEQALPPTDLKRIDAKLPVEGR